MRFALGIVGLVALLLLGCSGVSTTPYSAQQACQTVGGVDRDDGQCRRGLD